MEKIIYEELPYKVEDSHYTDDEFTYAIVTNVGTHNSDCQIINLRGVRKPGLEYPVTVANSQLTALSYSQIMMIRSYMK